VLAGWLTQALPAPQRDKTLFTAKTFISCHRCKLSKRGSFTPKERAP